MADALCRALSEITGTLDFRELVDRILTQLAFVIPSDSSNILLLEAGGLQSLVHHPHDRIERVSWIKNFRYEDLPTLKWMIDHQRALVIPYTNNFSGWVKNDETEWILSYAGAPICIKGEVAGFLNINSCTPGYFTPSDGANLQAFADQTAVAIENARLYDLAQQELAERKKAEATLKQYQEHLEDLVKARTSALTSANEQLQREIVERLRAEGAERKARHFAEVLRDAGLVLSACLDLEQVTEQVLEQIERVIPFDEAAIFVVEENRTRLVKTRPGSSPAPESRNLAHAGGKDSPMPTHLARLVEHRKPATIGDTRREGLEEAVFSPIPRTQSWVGAPILVEDRTIACLSLHKETPGFYRPEDAEHLQAFAGHAALAMENARLFAEVRFLAVTDPLTRLYNRRQFFVLATHELQRCQRQGKPVSVLMADVDRFKAVNDTHGHAVGDQILQAVAARFRDSLRAVDVLGRYGGEEFAILLPEADTVSAFKVAEAVRRIIADTPVASEAGPLPITLSLGVAGRSGKDAETLDSVLRRADRALYQAKTGGRNRVCLDTPDSKREEL